MADIYLGTSDSGLTPLPPIRWTDGGNPAMPLDYSKQFEEARMLSGGIRINCKSVHPRTWEHSWEMLTAAEFAVFTALNALNQALYYQNNWEDAVWRMVFIKSFKPEPALKLGPTVCRWNLTINLLEVR